MGNRDRKILEKALEERKEIEAKAWDAIQNKRMLMFGGYATTWVELTKIIGDDAEYPWERLVQLSKGVRV